MEGVPRAVPALVLSQNIPMQGYLLPSGDKAQGLLTLLPGAQTASFPRLLFLSSIAHSQVRGSQGPSKPRYLC